MTHLSARLFGAVALLAAPLAASAQSGNLLDNTQIHGDFQSDVQSYRADPAIGAPLVREQIRNNNFANLILTTGKLSAGVRYEAYLPPLQGFDQRYAGQGVPYRYATYDGGRFAVTVGNFYEQFGAGLIFRAYEERSLGIDNSLDGVRVRVQPFRGLHLTGVVGKQRFFFDKAPAIVRGVDAEISLNELIPRLDSAATRLTLGGSFVSKFQAGDDPTLILPENVGAGAGRLSLSNGGFVFNAEYAYKANDPSLVNNFIYKNGQALLITTSYARNGFGLVVGAKRVDNFDFRTDRNATGNLNRLNYLPALTKQHTYLLAASLYPYATQPLGEVSSQVELTYHVPSGSVGGKYGTDLSLNLSGVNGLNTTPPQRCHHLAHRVRIGLFYGGQHPLFPRLQPGSPPPFQQEGQGQRHVRAFCLQPGRNCSPRQQRHHHLRLWGGGRGVQIHAPPQLCAANSRPCKPSKTRGRGWPGCWNTPIRPTFLPRLTTNTTTATP